MLRRIIIIAVMPSATVANMKGQEVCFDAGFSPGTALRIYDSSVWVPPGTLQKALAPIGGGKTRTDVEVRTETWEVLDASFVRELTVSWSRYEHQYPVFVADSLRSSPELDRCYRLKRSPGIDTTFSYCDGTAIPRSRQKRIGYGRTTSKFPELLLRVFLGTCLTEEYRERIVERFYVVFSERKRAEYSDVTVDWTEADENGRVTVTLNFIETYGSILPELELEMNTLYEIEMIFDAATARLREIHSTETTMGDGDMPGDPSNSTIHSEQHLWIEWL